MRLSLKRVSFFSFFKALIHRNQLQIAERGTVFSAADVFQGVLVLMRLLIYLFFVLKGQ